MTIAEPLAPAPAGPAIDSLSPSRAADFTACPLRYRFRTIDRLPERVTPDQVRGTVVHAVLEQLFDLPPAERTPAAADELLEPAWERLAAERPELAELFDSAEAAAGWLASARPLLAGYFSLEDPSRLQPAEREARVEVALAGGVRLRGYVDRLDVAPGGAIRVVDYKTGRVPLEGFEAKAMFQLKFYALVIWRTRGVVPTELALYYLGDREVLRYRPAEHQLLGFERLLLALWAAIQRAVATGDFRAHPSRLCDWCDHRALCPAWGGTPPPWPPAGPPAGPAVLPAGDGPGRPAAG